MPRISRGFKPRNKYNAKTIVIDGIEFPSHAEGNYYKQIRYSGAEFKLHESFKIIDSFKLGPRTYRGAVYTPDVSFYHDGVLVSVVDVKGGNATLTDAAKLRMKAFMHRYKVPVIIARYSHGRFEEEQL